MKSPHRPPTPPNPAILDNHRPRIREVERRLMLRGGISLGMLTMLTGCSPESNHEIDAALLSISSFNDRVQGLLFNPDKLAPAYAASRVLKPPRFNAYYDIQQVKPVDGATWKLELGGLIADKRPWTTQQIAALPQRDGLPPRGDPGGMLVESRFWRHVLGGRGSAIQSWRPRPRGAVAAAW